MIKKDLFTKLNYWVHTNQFPPRGSPEGISYGVRQSKIAKGAVLAGERVTVRNTDGR